MIDDDDLNKTKEYRVSIKRAFEDNLSLFINSLIALAAIITLIISVSTFERITSKIDRVQILTNSEAYFDGIHETIVEFNKQYSFIDSNPDAITTITETIKSLSNGLVEYRRFIEGFGQYLDFEKDIARSRHRAEILEFVKKCRSVIERSLDGVDTTTIDQDLTIIENYFSSRRDYTRTHLP